MNTLVLILHVPSGWAIKTHWTARLVRSDPIEQTSRYVIVQRNTYVYSFNMFVMFSARTNTPPTLTLVTSIRSKSRP